MNGSGAEVFIGTVNTYLTQYVESVFYFQYL